MKQRKEPPKDRGSTFRKDLRRGDIRIEIDKWGELFDRINRETGTHKHTLAEFINPTGLLELGKDSDDIRRILRERLYEYRKVDDRDQPWMGYREEQIELFGDQNYRGIGKNENGYRVFWTKKDGFKVITDAEMRRSKDIFKDISFRHNILPEVVAAGALLKDTRVAEFKLKLAAAARTFTEVGKFVRVHANELGLKLQ